MKYILLVLTIALLAGCYAAHTVKQDYEVGNVASIQSVENALADQGYSICKVGNKNEYFFQNNSYPSFTLLSKNSILTIEMTLTHISRKQETEMELSIIESALLKVKGIKKLCRHNETIWGLMQDAESKCPSS